MPDDGRQRYSLAYRQARDQIFAREIPQKYQRLIPHITGAAILEIGSAEGVLAMLLARDGVRVTGLELREERHREALRLRKHWGVKGCRLLCGDIRDNLHLLQKVETLVAVRTIYYLRADAPAVIAHAASAGVRRVVLSGNRGRAVQSLKEPNTDLGKFNRLASIDGMRELLEAAGYRIETVVSEGDPIVVGVR